jgi:hypothetical protein
MWHVQHIEDVLDLEGKSITQFKQEFDVCSLQSIYERRFKHFNRLLSCIHSMIVGFNNLQLAIVFSKDFLMCCVAWLTTMFNFGLKLLAVNSSNCVVYALNTLMPSNPKNGCDEHGIWLKVVEDKETDTAVEWHKRKQAGKVLVHDTAIPVGEGTKTEDVGIW